MEIRDVIKSYPRLYHMAESGSWDSINSHGLLSTSAILDLFEYTGSKRYEIESTWRPYNIEIKHPIYGRAIIRDQAPMPPNDLQDCLVGISVPEWYKLINSKTFFWVSPYRRDKFLNATNYRRKSHTIITLSTKDLLESYTDNITLTDINTGFVFYGGKRGKDTFKTINDFPTNKKVWELAVDYAVHNIIDYAIVVEERKRDKLIEVIWKR